MSRRNITIQQHSGFGLLWIIGWLFTIGFLEKGFFGGLLALIIWPYMLGQGMIPS